MRITEIITSTSSYYTKALAALEQISANLPPTTNDLIDLINTALSQIAKPTADFRSRLNGRYVGGSQVMYSIDGEPAPWVFLTLPQRWSDDAVMRDEFPSKIKIIATTFAHEMGHVEQLAQHANPLKAEVIHTQQQWDEKSDLRWQRDSIKWLLADPEADDEIKTRARAFLYLTKKNEIDMQGYSAAQELWNYYEKHGPVELSKVIDLLRSWQNLHKSRTIIADEMPHLNQYVEFIRSGPYRSLSAYKRFLKKTLQYLQNMVDSKTD